MTQQGALYSRVSTARPRFFRGTLLCTVDDRRLIVWSLVGTVASAHAYESLAVLEIEDEDHAGRSRAIEAAGERGEQNHFHLVLDARRGRASTTSDKRAGAARRPCHGLECSRNSWSD
jgi:hypothetical protein